MKYNQKSSQVLMGVVASLFVSAAVSASGVAANQGVADASRAMAAQEKSMKAMVAPLAAPTAGIKKAAAPTPQPQVEGADAIRFVLNGVNIEGNTAVSTDELKSIYSGKVGKEVSLSEVYKMAEAMEVAYRMKGFEFSSVLVPEQKVSGGVVKLVVVEASIGEVRFEGELRGRQDIMDSIKEKLLASKPLRNADLERYVLLLNDMPGVQATATLGKSAMKNMTDVTFTLKAKPFDVAVVADNSKPEKLGTYQGTGMVSLNNVMGLYEKLTLRGSTDKDFGKSRYGSGSLSAVLFSEGTQATLSGMYSDTAPAATKLGTAIAADQVNGKTKGFTVDLMHPFVRTRAVNFRLNAGFDYKDSSTTIKTTATDANYRSINVGGTFDVADAAAGVTVFNAEGEFGLDALSATVSTAKDATGKYVDAVNGNVSVNNFKKFSGTVTRLQSVPGAPGLSFTLSGTGQYTSDPLPSSKEFSFGGRDYGRGLDSGIMTGDKGYAAKLEVRYAYPVNVVKIEPYAFGEYGTSWNNDNKVLDAGDKTFKKQVDAEDTLSAFTLGGGLKLDIAEYVSIYGEGAWVMSPSKGLKGKFSKVADDKAAPAIKDTATDAEKAQRDGTVRVFFGLTARY